MVLLIIDFHREERPMDSMTASGIHGVLMRAAVAAVAAVAAAVAGVAVLGATGPAMVPNVDGSLSLPGTPGAI
jgi:hypothetical protein